MAPQFVPLSPRLSLLEKSLEQAAAVALERRVRLRLRDLPLCVAPRLRPLFAAPDSEVWVTAGRHACGRAREPASGCATCPGAPQCAGAPRRLRGALRLGGIRRPGAAAARVARERRRISSAARRRAPMVVHLARTASGALRGLRRCAGRARRSSAAATNRRASCAPGWCEAARYRPSVLRLVGADLLAHPQARAA